VRGLVCFGFCGRGGFGFACKQTAFQFTDFALQVPYAGRQNGFAFDGTLVLSPPVVGLATQVDKLALQIANDKYGEPKKQSELTEAVPQEGQRIELAIVLRVGVGNECRGQRNQRSLLGRERNQRVGGVRVHSPQIVGNGDHADINGRGEKRKEL